MYKCIITDQEITTENNSKAHVIPSCLGGRLKPLNILSEDGNSALNDTVDLPLIKAFQPLMSLINGSRDRGTNPSIKMTDEDGKKYLVNFGEFISPQTPSFEEETLPDGSLKISIKARTRKEARELLGKIKKSHPQFDVEEALQSSLPIEKYLDGKLNFSFDVGPGVTFPAAFAAASIFSVYSGLDQHPLLKSYIDNFDPEMTPSPLPPDTFFWYPTEGIIHKDISKVSHTIILLSDSIAKKSFIFIEYFDIICIGVIVPYDGAKNISNSYSVNVLDGKHYTPSFDEAKFRSEPWSASHQLGDPKLFEILQHRTSRVAEIGQQRARSAEIGRILSETIPIKDGQPISFADFDKATNRIVQFYAHLLKNSSRGM